MIRVKIPSRDLLLVGCLLLFAIFALPQEVKQDSRSCWFNGSAKSPDCILENADGTVLISPEYLKQLEFDSYGLAAVQSDIDGWMYVNRKGRVVVRGVPTYDNWADSFSGGLVRTVVKHKYGFANRSGRIVIAPKFDWASPFEHGYAEACDHCHEECALPGEVVADPPGGCDHHVMVGGEWFKIDKSGKIVRRLRR